MKNVFFIVKINQSTNKVIVSHGVIIQGSIKITRDSYDLFHASLKDEKKINLFLLFNRDTWR